MLDCRESIVRLGDASVESQSMCACQTLRSGGEAGRFRKFRRGRKPCRRFPKRGASAFFFFCGRAARGFFRSPVFVFASVRPVSARLGKPFDVQEDLRDKETKSRIIEVFSRRAAEDPCDGSLGRRNKSPRDDRTLQGSRHRPSKPLSGAFGLQSPLSAAHFGADPAADRAVRSRFLL